MSITYKKLRAKIEASRTGVWNYGCNWLRLILDEKTKNLYVGHKRWEQNKEGDTNWEPIEKGRIIIRPDDVLIVNNEGGISSILLGTFGVHGKILRGTSPKAVYTYRHEMMTDYEGLPFMELRLSDSKPLKARKFDDIEYDAEKLRWYRSQLKDLRTVYAGFQRLKDSNTEQIKSKRKSTQTIYNEFNSNAKKIVDVLHAIHSEKKVNIIDKIDFLVGFHGNWGNYFRTKIFDNSIKFHKALVFRMLGVVT